MCSLYSGVIADVTWSHCALCRLTSASTCRVRTVHSVFSMTSSPTLLGRTVLSVFSRHHRRHWGALCTLKADVIDVSWVHCDLCVLHDVIAKLPLQHQRHGSGCVFTSQQRHSEKSNVTMCVKELNWKICIHVFLFWINRASVTSVYCKLPSPHIYWIKYCRHPISATQETPT